MSIFCHYRCARSATCGEAGVEVWGACVAPMRAWSSSSRWENGYASLLVLLLVVITWYIRYIHTSSPTVKARIHATFDGC